MNIKFEKLLIIIILSLGTGNSIYSQHQIIDFDSNTLAKQVLKKYSEIKYYSDSVKVQIKTNYTKKHKTLTSNISYRTSFIRDKYFELNGDFSSSYYPLVIKSGVYYYLKDSISWIKRGDLPTEYVNRNINLGLGRVVGGLGCKVNIIPNLLIPDVLNAINNLINHDTLQILRDTIINDYECYLIKATLGEINNRATLDLKKQNVQIYEVYEAYYSIRKSDLVILALTNKITYPDKIKVETMQFAPIINNKNYVKRKKEFK